MTLPSIIAVNQKEDELIPEFTYASLTWIKRVDFYGYPKMCDKLKYICFKCYKF